MTRLRARAPGKVNLCLYLGDRRSDGLHELVSVVQAVSLADEVTLAPAAPGAQTDEIVCTGVDGINLAEKALAGFRRHTGWDAAPQRVTIEKRVPVAGGMGGGSSDAAATLRLVAHAASVSSEELAGLIEALGADVPALFEPGAWLVSGAGEHLRRVRPPADVALVVVPLGVELRTAEVFREADRLGLPRTGADLQARREDVEVALAAGKLPLGLMHNDLEPATRSLCPAVDAPLDSLRGAGADRALVSGSGPTLFGLFEAGRPAATAAAAELRDRYPAATVCEPVDAGFAAPTATPEDGV